MERLLGKIDAGMRRGARSLLPQPRDGRSGRVLGRTAGATGLVLVPLTIRSHSR
ncbi:MAG TPA: hypothetical protein PLB02_05355 [Thermoanaerobaculia bacterium]|nr:hypothetical protein [Thermoanaerobaculia bacterium]HQR66801.1 hypothetical protein [Thermoanaerobaculia bacterium]